jgi:hypothetical protein
MSDDVVVHGSAATVYPDTTGWPTPKLPGLKHDDEIFGKGILNIVVRAMVGQLPAQGDRNGYRGLLNLVRLTDKAINEYLAACEACAEFEAHKNEGRVSPFFRAIDHVESCINSVYRATRHARRLRSRIETAELDRTDWRAIRNAETQLRKVRDTIEHAEEQLASGVITDEQLGLLWLNEYSLAIGSCEVSYANLAMWIERVHKIATALRIAEVCETDATSPVSQ